MATPGDATINGVPAFALPKISNCVGRIDKPALAASASLWSIRAKIVRPFGPNNRLGVGPGSLAPSGDSQDEPSRCPSRAHHLGFRIFFEHRKNALVAVNFIPFDL